MQSKSVLVTGCSSGIGLHIAHALQRRGYRVFASARGQDDVESLARQGLRCIRLDVSRSEDIRRAVEAVTHETGGQLFALINNAGYGQPGAVEDLSRKALQRQFDTNLFGLVELTNAVIPMMRKQGYGRIVQISSVLGFVAMPFRGAYIASKFALEGITDALRLELRDSDVYVSLIEPGPITSRFRENSLLMYKRYIDGKDSHFRLQYQTMEERLDKEGAVAPFTLEPEAVLRKVVRALESRTPKARYFVTFPTYLFAMLKKALPAAVMDWLLVQASKAEHR